MKKRFLLFVACAMALLVLAGCSDKEEKKQVENKDLVEIELNVKPLEKVEKKTLSESALSLGFENEKLFHAFANAIGKKPEEVTGEDVNKIHFVAVGPEEQYEYSLFVGYIDYVDLCLSDQVDDPDFSKKLGEKVMMSELDYDIENDSLSDLGNFKNVEMFEIYDVKVEDVSFVKNYNKLVYGFFKNNGITDVSLLAGYNPESLRELDFTGNEITDWKPVEQIKDKIVVFYDMASGFRITLESFLEQTEAPVNTPTHENGTEQTENVQSQENTEKTNKEDEYFVVDQDGNPADFGSLFD